MLQITFSVESRKETESELETPPVLFPLEHRSIFIKIF